MRQEAQQQQMSVAWGAACALRLRFSHDTLSHAAWRSRLTASSVCSVHNDTACDWSAAAPCHFLSVSLSRCR